MTAAWLRRNAWLIAASVVSLGFTVQPFRDGEVWWGLAVGRHILAHGIPSTEPFSFLHAVSPWVGQQWLYDVGLARVVDLGGAGLASLLMGVVASAALLMAALSIPPSRRPHGAVMGGALLLGAVVCTQMVGVRASVMSLLLAAVTLSILGRWRRGSVRVLLALPPLMVLWANLDSGFVVGIGMAVIALLTSAGVSGRARRLLGASTLAAVLATLLNPAGIGLWGSVTATLTDPALAALVPELQSPNFHDTWLRLFEAQAVLLVLAWALSPRREAFDVVLAGAVFAASLEAERFVSLFAVLAVPQLAVYGAAAWEANRGRLTRGPGGGARWRAAPAVLGIAAVAGAAAITAVAVAPRLTATGAARIEATTEPKAAADYAAGHLAGSRLYTVGTWGGYLTDRFPAGRVVFLYDQPGVFGAATVQEYLDIHDLSPRWSSVLADEGVTDAILPARAQEVSGLLTLGWTVDCRDDASGSLVMSFTGDDRGAAAGVEPPACG